MKDNKQRVCPVCFQVMVHKWVETTGWNGNEDQLHFICEFCGFETIKCGHCGEETEIQTGTLYEMSHMDGDDNWMDEKSTDRLKSVFEIRCPKCCIKLDDGIIENECLGIGPGEDCDVCPHYDCCDAIADETEGQGMVIKMYKKVKL